MALLLNDLRTALVSAGVDDDLASKAATEVATYEGRLSTMDTRVSVLTWMVGANLALTTAIVISQFALWSKLADLSARFH